MTNAARPSALILASGDWAGLARLPRYLHLAGARVDVMAPRGSRLAASRFVSKTLPAGKDADETLERLRRLMDGGGRRDWVIFGDDALLDRAVRRRDEPWLAALLPAGPGADAAAALSSKTAFSRAMRESGVPRPESRGASGPAEIAAAAAAIGYPVFVKPDGGWSGTGVRLVRSVAGSEPVLDGAAGAHIVEAAVEGRLGATAVLFDGGRPAWWSSFYKEGVWPPPYGPSCRRRPGEPAGLEPILAKIGAALGLHGLHGVDWVLTPSGALSILELNGRPIPMAESSEHVALGLPAALRDFLAGRPAVRRPPASPDGALWHAMPASYLLACEKREWGLAAGLLCGLGGRTDAPWHDPGLLPRYVGGVAVTALRRLITGG